MQRFPYDLRKEAVALWSRVGIPRILLIHLALVLVFGVYLPWTKGLQFLDPVIIAAYACLGVVFAAPAAAQAFAEERPRSMSGALARAVMAVLYGECMAAVILLAGFLTVARHSRGVLLVDLRTLATAGALGITASFALAVIAGWISLRFSSGVARGVLRVVFLLLLVLFFFKSQGLPEVAGAGALVCLVLAAAASVALRAVLDRQE